MQGVPRLDRPYTRDLPQQPAPNVRVPAQAGAWAEDLAGWLNDRGTSRTDHRRRPGAATGIADQALRSDGALAGHGIQRPGRIASRPGRSRRLALAATGIVLLVVAGTLALALPGHRSPAAPQARPSTRAPAASASPAGATTPAGLVTVAAAAAAAPQASAVVSVVSRYFTAINQHDYSGYRQLFVPAVRAQLSAAGFAAGYGSSTDSAITVHGIDTVGTGELAARLTFTSHQQPSASPTHSACTAWTISLYLVRQGGKYLLQDAPAGYVAKFADCS